MFLAQKVELASLMSSPPLSPTLEDTPRSMFLHDPSAIATPAQSRQGYHRKGASSTSDWTKGHRRANSSLSYSQYSLLSSSATNISRPLSPDSFEFPPSKPGTKGSQAKASNSNSKDSSQRWSSPSSTLRHISEQERLLQEKLQQLARSENARLCESERASSPTNSRPVSYIEPSTRPQKRNSISISVGFKPGHQRNLSLQPYFNTNNVVPGLSESPPKPTSTPSQVRPQPAPMATPVPSQDSKEAARAAALAQLSGEVQPKVTSLKPVLEPLQIPDAHAGRKRRRSVQSPGQYIISSHDILKLGSEAEEEKPSRFKTELGGSALSWKMAGDIVMTSGKAYHSPETLFELVRYLWVMFSNPETAKGISISESQWLPPSDLVVTLKDNLISGISQATVRNVSDSFWTLSKIVGGCACTSLAFTIILLQIFLLSLMVFAFILGDIVMSPFHLMKRCLYPSKEVAKETTEEKKTPEECAKAHALKVQRAARKAIRRRSKRRSRH